MTCKVNGADTAAIIREGQCLWAGASANFLDAGTTFDQIGFTQTAGLFNAGVQVAIDDVWRLGVGGGYQSSTLQTATNAQSEGSLAQGGVSLKYNPGPLLLAGVISGGGAWYDTTPANGVRRLYRRCRGRTGAGHYRGGGARRLRARRRRSSTTSRSSI